MDDLIVVELTNRDVNLLKFLQKNYKNIERLENAGVFDVRGKTVHLHIDPVGIIRNIDVLIRKL